MEVDQIVWTCEGRKGEEQDWGCPGLSVAGRRKYVVEETEKERAKRLGKGMNQKTTRGKEEVVGKFGCQRKKKRMKTERVC